MQCKRAMSESQILSVAKDNIVEVRSSRFFENTAAIPGLDTHRRVRKLHCRCITQLAVDVVFCFFRKIEHEPTPSIGSEKNFPVN